MSSVEEHSAATDEELMAAIAAGQEQALNELLRRHGGMVFGLCQRILHQTVEAEELVTEVFWELWTCAERYDESRGNARSYLVLLSRSRALDRLRELRSRRVHFPSSTDGSPLEVVPDSKIATPAGALLLREQKVALEVGLEGLVSPQRQAISLAFFDGLTHREIAQRMALPLGTVKTHIRAGLKKLRYRLEWDDSGDSQ